jgi:hypothetical protein
LTETKAKVCAAFAGRVLFFGIAFDVLCSRDGMTILSDYRAGVQCYPKRRTIIDLRPRMEPKARVKAEISARGDVQV